MKRSWNDEFGYPTRYSTSQDYDDYPSTRYPRLDSVTDRFQSELAPGPGYYGRVEPRITQPRLSGIGAGRSAPTYINPEYFDNQHSSRFEGVSRGMNPRVTSLEDLILCVDYIRGMCKNGPHCPKAHVDYVESIDERELIAKHKFCHNFQNRGICTRPGGCNFLHVTRYEEDEFLLIGKIPRTVFERSAAAGTSQDKPLAGKRGGGRGGRGGRQAMPQAGKQKLVNNTSFCIDFLKGTCLKEHCPLRHVECVEDEGDRYDIVANVFCHDYLNNKCIRSSCKYVHAERSEEQYFMENGYFPPTTNARNSEKMFMTEVCLDNLRNQCIRGSKCNFKHVTLIEDASERRIVSRSVFCHDFQDGQCQRSFCKLLHASAQDEAYFLNYGRVPEHLTLPTGKRDPGLDKLAKEVCRDFVKNKCVYGERCKYYHPKSHEIHALVVNSKTSSKQRPQQAYQRKPSPPNTSEPGVSPETEALQNRVKQLEKLLADACYCMTLAVGDSHPAIASLMQTIAELAPASALKPKEEHLPPQAEDMQEMPATSQPGTSQTETS